MIYTSLVALAQEDMKKLIAYSSVAHMGVVTIGIFTFNVQGIQGALFQMLSHGIVSAALFLVSAWSTTASTRVISPATVVSPIACRSTRSPSCSSPWPRSVCLAPSGFVGEFLVIVGALQVNFWLALLGATGMILGAAYMLYLYRRVIFGRLTKEDLRSHPRPLAARNRSIRTADPARRCGWVFIRRASAGSGMPASRRWCSITPRHSRPRSSWRGWCTDELGHRAAGARLSIVAMAILIFGVLRRDDTFFISSMLALGGFLLAALLVATSPRGVGYHGQFVADAFSSFMKILVLSGAALALILSLDYNRHEHIARFEYPVLMALSVVGMMVMVSAANLMTLYLGLELQSLALYVLAAFARDELRSSEAGLKYFVLGALASGLLLYGISLVYGFSGTMDFAALAKTLSQPQTVSPGLIVGIVFVLVGLAFKISAVPFHMWTPDVYEGAPTPVTVFFSTAPKVAAMALLLRTMTTPFGHQLVAWQQLIVLISIASMILGALAAIGQHNIKRLMAYSSIGHMGYALIGLAVGTPEGVRGVLVYLIVYVFMSAGTFACIIAMRRRGRALEEITDLNGLARTDPGLALAMAVFMFSMAGIPPLSGFFGKLYVFLAAVQSGMWTLAVIGVLTSVVGAYYYVRIVKVMYFDAPDAPFDPRPASLSFVAAATGLFTTFFFIFPAPFVGAAQAAAKVLFG